MKVGSLVFNANTRESTPYERTIHEHRAPTDDSIRLYEEMKEKAYKSILDTIKINDNILNLKAIIYKDPSHNHICSYSLTLNGEEFSGKFTISDFELQIAEDKGEVLRRVVENISKVLAVRIVKAGINHEDSNFFREALK